LQFVDAERASIADLTWLLAGAGGPRLLASLGAEIIRIEWRDRLDFLRYMPPFAPLKSESVEKAGAMELSSLSKEGLKSVKSLSGEDLMHAVSRGAAYYGLARQGRGVRIRGGIRCDSADAANRAGSA